MINDIIKIIINVEDGGFQKGEGTCLDFYFLSSVAGEFDHFIVCCVFEHSIALSLIEDNRIVVFVDKPDFIISYSPTSWKTTE